MQKFVNDPSKVVDEMLEAYVKVHSDLVSPTENERVIKYKEAPIKGKVGIVTGGGSGHKPAFIGYVGRNMVDAVACGEIFSSPPAQMFYDAIKEADGGEGVALLYGNYAGDNMNVAMAIDEAEDNDIEVKKVVANDDVPSAPKGQEEKRRGVAGEILMWKVGGAKAAMGASLDDVITAAQKAIDNTRSMGIGLAALWVKEVSRAGIIEALQNRRTFATTGDKMVIDIKVNGAITGTTSTAKKVPQIVINVCGQHPLEKVEILRNSKVIHQFDIDDDALNFAQTFSDRKYQDEEDVLYYYVRATQKNRELAWSSPVWIDKN